MIAAKNFSTVPWYKMAGGCCSVNSVHFKIDNEKEIIKPWAIGETGTIKIAFTPNSIFSIPPETIYLKSIPTHEFLGDHSITCIGKGYIKVSGKDPFKDHNITSWYASPFFPPRIPHHFPIIDTQENFIFDSLSNIEKRKCLSEMYELIALENQQNVQLLLEYGKLLESLRQALLQNLPNKQQ